MTLNLSIKKAALCSMKSDIDTEYVALFIVD